MARTRDEFPVFIKEWVRPALKPRGYRSSGQTYSKSVGPATAYLVFMRYTIRRGCFDMRMSIGLDCGCELGAVVSADLSIYRHGSVEGAPWRWPCPAAEWPSLAALLVPDVVLGAQWLEDLLDLRKLAKHLEGQRRFSAEVDDQFARTLDHMQAAGITPLYESPGFRQPRAGKIRPDRVRALSYCYELLGEWKSSLDAWTDYLATFRSPLNTEHPEVRQALERSAFLAQRSEEPV